MSGTSLVSPVGVLIATVTNPLNETEVVTEVHKQTLSVYSGISKVSESSTFAHIYHSCRNLQIYSTVNINI